MPATLRRELARKSLHLASAVVPLAYAAGVARPVLLATLGAAGAVALTVELARARWPRARALFTGAVGVLLREHEHDRWSGATWLCAAYLLAVLLFPRPVAVAAMLAAAFGDAVAAIVGRAWAARRARRASGARIAPRAKTWAGTIACALVATLAAFYLAALPLGVAAASGVAAALAERPRGPLDDNVRIVLAAGAAALAALAVAARLAT